MGKYIFVFALVLVINGLISDIDAQTTRTTTKRVITTTKRVITTTKKDPCLSGPCKNGATCVALSTTTFRCDCPTCFSGTVCLKADPCCVTPCQNNGTCTPNGDDVTCACEFGFNGRLCEDIDACASSPCLNNGTCINAGSGNYTCNCNNTNFSGPQCETPNGPQCNSYTCSNVGNCTTDGTVMSCSCPEGYLGNFCETANACLSSITNPCLNGANCTMTSNGILFCSCPQGYYGPLCESTNPCDNNPCLNGGTCKISAFNGYAFCDCGMGFKGDFCERSSSQ